MVYICAARLCALLAAAALPSGEAATGTPAQTRRHRLRQRLAELSGDSGNELHMDRVRAQGLSTLSSAATPGANETYMDPVLAYCYATGQANSSLFEKFIDRTPADVDHDVVLRPNTHTWCLGDLGLKPSVAACEAKEPVYDRPVPADSMRGYDLVQTPRGATCSSPRVMYVHGGSWYYYSPFGDEGAYYYVHTSKIARHTGAVVLSLDYPLIGGWACRRQRSGCETTGGYAGDFKGMLAYAEAAWEWLGSHGPRGERCPGPRPPLFLAGDSSGGGTALSVLLSLNERRKRGVLGQMSAPSGGFFESPWTNLRSNSPTYYSNNFAAFPDVLTASMDATQGCLVGDILFHFHRPKVSENVADPWIAMEYYYLNGLNYCGMRAWDILPSGQVPHGTCGTDKSADAQAHYWLASPYFATPDQVKGLPPMYFATSATELLAADTSVFSERAASVGVNVVSELFHGVWHTFPQWSEGCGSGKPLWQGVTALRNFGNFVDQVVRATKECPRRLEDHSGSAVPDGGKAVNRLRNLKDPTGYSPLDMELCGGGSGVKLASTQPH